MMEETPVPRRRRTVKRSNRLFLRVRRRELGGATGPSRRTQSTPDPLEALFSEICASSRALRGAGPPGPVSDLPRRYLLRMGRSALLRPPFFAFLSPSLLVLRLPSPVGRVADAAVRTSSRLWLGVLLHLGRSALATLSSSATLAPLPSVVRPVADSARRRPSRPRREFRRKLGHPVLPIWHFLLRPFPLVRSGILDICSTFLPLVLPGR